MNLVAAGMGVAIVPASLRHPRPDGVACRPFALDWPRAVLGLALRENAGGRAANLPGWRGNGRRGGATALKRD